MSDKLEKSSKKWRKLDNAAKVFPATASKRNTKVFRFYCELKEEVVRENLQEALEITLNKYTLFKSVMRRGLFWYYLEHNEYLPIVKEENKSPCSQLYTSDRIKYLFRVNYYKKRINFEVFHVLTDGTGATEFLRELVKNYLYITHKESGLENIELQPSEYTTEDHEDDSFSKYYDKNPMRRAKKYQGAHQIRGIKSEFDVLQVMEGVIETKAALAKAKEYGVSISVFLSAVLLCAIHEEMHVRQTKKPVVLMLPVNLRNFFPSKSMLNFFGFIEPGYHFGVEEDHTLEAVIRSVKRYFDEELTKEKMEGRMNEYTRLEKHPLLRLTPLEVKNLGIQLVFTKTVRDMTAIFSNMSVVKMPPEYETYIHQFGVLTSTHKVELCMCSFQNRMVLNFTSYFESQNVQRNFFRILKDCGLAIEYTEGKYPEIQEEQKKEFYFQKSLNFTAIVIATLLVMMNILLTPERMWSLWGMGIVAGMWLSGTIGFKKRTNLLKNASMQLLIVSVITLAADLITGFAGWSIEYVIPITTLTVISVALMIIKFQKINVRNYVTYLFNLAIFGMLPVIIFLLNPTLNRVWPVVCITSSFLLATYILIFKKNVLFKELQKKLHV